MTLNLILLAIAAALILGGGGIAVGVAAHQRSRKLEQLLDQLIAAPGSGRHHSGSTATRLMPATHRPRPTRRAA